MIAIAKDHPSSTHSPKEETHSHPHPHTGRQESNSFKVNWITQKSQRDAAKEANPHSQ
jgi:hypothetical protein